MGKDVPMSHSIDAAELADALDVIAIGRLQARYGDIVSRQAWGELEGGRVVAVIGAEDLIVVDTPDALLICKQDQSQEVKWVVEKLKHSSQQKVL